MINREILQFRVLHTTLYPRIKRDNRFLQLSSLSSHYIEWESRRKSIVRYIARAQFDVIRWRDNDERRDIVNCFDIETNFPQRLVPRRI